MAELHDLLERESARYALPPGAAERMFERGRRRERNRKMTAIGVGAMLFLAVLAIILRRYRAGASRSLPYPRR